MGQVVRLPRFCLWQTNQTSMAETLEARWHDALDGLRMDIKLVE